MKIKKLEVDMSNLRWWWESHADEVVGYVGLFLIIGVVLLLSN